MTNYHCWLVVISSFLYFSRNNIINNVTKTLLQQYHWVYFNYRKSQSLTNIGTLLLIIRLLWQHLVADHGVCVMGHHGWELVFYILIFKGWSHLKKNYNIFVTFLKHEVPLQVVGSTPNTYWIVSTWGVVFLAQWVIHKEDRILVFLEGVEGIGRLDKNRRLLGMVIPGAKEAILQYWQRWRPKLIHPPSFFSLYHIANYVIDSACWTKWGMDLGWSIWSRMKSPWLSLDSISW